MKLKLGWLVRKKFKNFHFCGECIEIFTTKKIFSNFSVVKNLHEIEIEIHLLTSLTFSVFNLFVAIFKKILQNIGIKKSIYYPYGFLRFVEKFQNTVWIAIDQSQFHFKII